MTKHLKPREQGDIGELSAMQWFAEQGAHVFVPLGHSPDVDLVALLGERTIRVEVKTGTHRTSNGGWSVGICTHGGNQSWNGLKKYFDPKRCDYLFVLVGDGRRWLIPSGAIESRTALTLGGRKYESYEIEAAAPLTSGRVDAGLDSPAPPGECPSGQRERAVNASAQPSQVRILSPPSRLYERVPGAPYEPPKPPSEAPASALTTIYAKRRVTLPATCFAGGRLEIGSRMRVEPLGDGKILLTPSTITGASDSSLAQQRLIDDVADAT